MIIQQNNLDLLLHDLWNIHAYDQLSIVALMILKDSQGFFNLVQERIRGFDQIQKFSIVHFQQHARDFTRLLWLVSVDERVQTLTNHILLHLRVSLG